MTTLVGPDGEQHWYNHSLHPGQVILDAGTKKNYIGNRALAEWKHMEDIKKIIQDAGGYTKVAKMLGTKKQVVWSWVNVLGKVPPKWVNQLSELIKVPRYKIRPDIYPKSREFH